MGTAYINKRKKGQLVKNKLGSIVAVGRNSLQVCRKRSPSYMSF